VNFVYDGEHLFAYKIDGPSAGAAESLTVRNQPSALFINFLTAVRAGEGKLERDGHIAHEAFSSFGSLRHSLS
jgi:hypothetical protein